MVQVLWGRVNRVDGFDVFDGGGFRVECLG